MTTAAGLDLTGADFEYELLSHPRTERALDEATSLGVPAEEVAKTIVVRVTATSDLATRTAHARIVLPAPERLDLHKLRTFFGEGHEVALATEAELAAAYAEFELGAVPPVGGPSGDAVIVDPRVAARESVVFEAGTHDRSIRMRAADLIRATGAAVVDICEG